jgi:3-deoxy-manno-octulosonate cytidylyltransferase (CMP-KDO synthetase)
MKPSQLPKIIGIVPARFGSTRFPGKPLVKIHGKSLIQHTYENAKKCQSLDELVVATDDSRIFDHVTQFGGKVMMTSEMCPTGTDRLAEVVKTSEYQDADIIINIQGDEPCLDPDSIEAVIRLLKEDTQAVMGTCATPIRSEEEITNPNIVKCVLDRNQNALYFSRSTIPYLRTKAIVYRHMGLYGYRRDFLLTYQTLSLTPLQLAEDLEQLKVLEHGFRIKVALVDELSIGVDTPADIQKVEDYLCKQNTSL